LLQRVVYNGIHGGDHINVEDVADLANELESAKSLIVADPEKAFFLHFIEKMCRLCEASLGTGHPIVF
jgi:hypothetical protein